MFAQSDEKHLEAEFERLVGSCAADRSRFDFTAFTVDPLLAAADEVASAPIALTVVDGRIQHRG